MVLLQVSPEQAAQRVGHAHQGGVVEFGGPLGQVGGEQLPHGLAPAGRTCATSSARGALAGHPGGSQDRRGADGKHAGLGQQRVEQGPVVGPLALVLLQRVAELDAVADGDVADQAALVEQDPGDPVEGFLAVLGVAPARRVAVGPEPGEPGRVEPAAGLVEQHAGTVAQQPAIAGAQDLAGEHQPHRRQQVGADMLGRAGRRATARCIARSVQRRPAASAPLASQRSCQVWPGCCSSQSSSAVEPAPHGPADVGAAGPERRRRQPLHQQLGASLLGLRPASAAGPGRVLLAILRRPVPGGGATGRRAMSMVMMSPHRSVGRSPNRACSTSGR